MSELLVTLGHNSSAIRINDGLEVEGYEQERLDKIKSSSAAPFDAVREMYTPGYREEIDDLYVTHWFDHFGRGALKNDKYWNWGMIPDGTEIKNVHTHTPDLTHHDCHAWSAVAFREHYAIESEIPEGTMILVVDGFGNFQECVSVYQWKYGTLRLQRRIYGYDQSLGLMYQYATSLAGMKENADEYKFLGYINDHNPDERQTLFRDADKISRDIQRGWERSQRPSFYNNVNRRIDLPQLMMSRRLWHDRLRAALSNPSLQKVSAEHERRRIGVIAQKVVEDCVLSLVPRGTDHLIVAGGVFMNVRLNDLLARRVEKTFTAMPLAGDQGAAIGMRRAIRGKATIDWNDLIIGKRKKLLSNRVDLLHKMHGDLVVRAGDEAQATISDLLNEDYLVNVFRTRGMEFGSRALCHTSTLALPSLQNVQAINRLNDRSTVMPMAPVMTRTMYEALFPGYAKTATGHENFMIAACSAEDMTGLKIKKSMRGAAHPDPYEKTRISCRPQVTSDTLTEGILNSVESPCLINTSLNFHCEPIIYSLDDLENLHARWTKRKGLVNKNFMTVVVDED